MGRWRVEQRPSMYDLIWDDEDDRQHLVAEVHQAGVADRIVRAMNWEADGQAKAARLQEAIERHCRAFESSSLPGMGLVVGDLRAALDASRR